MIKCLRVDHRLLHGQVAFSWINALGADCILIANDDVPKDELRKAALKLAKPSGVKLVIKSIKESIYLINKGVTDKYKLFILVESIKDAKNMALSCKSITEVNLGGTKDRKGTRGISKAIYVTKEEEQMIHQMVDDGIKVNIRMVPLDKEIDAIKALSGGG